MMGRETEDAWVIVGVLGWDRYMDLNILVETPSSIHRLDLSVMSAVHMSNDNQSPQLLLTHRLIRTTSLQKFTNQKSRRPKTDLYTVYGV